MTETNDPGQWPDKTSTPGQRRALRVIAILMILAAICFIWKKWADNTVEPFDDTLQQEQGRIPDTPFIQVERPDGSVQTRIKRKDSI